ncbi:replication factor C 4, 37kDa [Hyaloraphidium curvatum]|nr:replication factor C 4, 37kDa [Hyaloraphidium curvatum]
MSVTGAAPERTGAAPERTGAAPERSIPWVEKYRPKKIDQVSSQEETVAVLKRTIESENLPHLLFYGPPGTGKTSTILALAHDLYGPEQIRSRVLELNASDERGIEIVREKVKNFARVSVTQRSQGGHPCPPYKIVILDEADSMTSDAQSALRRTMETYSKITRFCLICNYVSRIIEPLASRCAKFRFRPLDDASMIARLKHVISSENVNIEEQAIEVLIKVADGDLRKAITFLQSAHRLHGSDMITADSLFEIAGVVPAPVLETLLLSMWSNSFDKMMAAVNAATVAGYSVGQIVSQLHDSVISDPRLTTRQKAALTQHLGHIDKCLTDGADEQLQLMAFMGKVIGLSH